MPLGDADFHTWKQSRTDSPPRILYKYASADTARIILSTGKLRFQSPIHYNDPFDAQWDPFWSTKTPEANQYERTLIEQALVNPNSWPSEADPAHRQAMNVERANIESMLEGVRNRAIVKFVQDAGSKTKDFEPFYGWWRDYQRRLRVLCLCEDAFSLLMWSHYADQHRGVVLGFDSALIEDQFKRPFERVTYQNDLPSLVDYKSWFQSHIFGTSVRAFSDEKLRLTVLCKHIGWQYEREWRFVWAEPPGKLEDFADIPIPRDALVQLVMGYRIMDAHATELQTLADGWQHRIQKSRASMHSSQFALVQIDLPSR